jgi:ketosteroid isomerase-like protein
MSQDTAALNQELDNMIAQGQAMEAFEKFYADDVVMQENAEEPRRGKDVNREFEKQFFSSIEEFHGAEMVGSAATGDRSYSEWTMDVTFKGAGRVQMSECAARQWKDGKVVHERFYYNKG